MRLILNQQCLFFQSNIVSKDFQTDTKTYFIKYHHVVYAIPPTYQPSYRKAYCFLSLNSSYKNFHSVH